MSESLKEPTAEAPRPDTTAVVEEPYTVGRAAEIARVSANHIYAEIRDKKITPVKFEDETRMGQIGIMPSELTRYLSSRRRRGRPATVFQESEKP